MKRTDFCFALAIVAIFLPFVLCSPLYEWYKEFNATHGMMMSFFKFGILSTMGEMLGCRISTGNYVTPTFGILPRMIVWGLLGMGINMAMIIFSKGTPMFMEYMGMKDAVNSFTAAAFTMDKTVGSIGCFGSHEYHFCTCIHDFPQNNGCTYCCSWRFTQGSCYSYPDGRTFRFH